jgi:hypothetical protein
MHQEYEKDVGPILGRVGLINLSYFMFVNDHVPSYALNKNLETLFKILKLPKYFRGYSIFKKKKKTPRECNFYFFKI